MIVTGITFGLLMLIVSAFRDQSRFPKKIFTLNNSLHLLQRACFVYKSVFNCFINEISLET